MAFLQHPRRKPVAAGKNALEQGSLNNPSRPHLITRSSDRRESNEGGQEDWNIVFPGRSRTVNFEAAQTDASHPPSPFRCEPDEEGLQLTLPPAHDGTGRFAQPNSPNYDEEQRRSPESVSPLSPSIIAAPSEISTLDSFISDEDDDDNEEINFEELASSAMLTESEAGRSIATGSTAAEPTDATNFTAAQLQRASQQHPSGTDPKSDPFSSWSWMDDAHVQAPNSSALHGSAATSLYLPASAWDDVQATLTSDSEGENSEAKAIRARRRKEDAAFEEALGSAHLAQSAGLRPRIPKRRHRRNGESEKGSKRSNTSAALTGELLSAQHQQRRRAALQSGSARRSHTSNTSAAQRSARSATRRQSMLHGEPLDGPSVKQTSSRDTRSKTERLVGTVLRHVFGVDDDDVLEAFLRDEGPLQVSREEQDRAANAAAIAARQPRGAGRFFDSDDVWSRNQRQKHMRLLMDGHSVPEDVNEEQGEESQDEDASASSSKTIGNGDVRFGQHQGSTQRLFVSANVAEPSLAEALHATVLSGLRIVPSRLAVLLAGSSSVRIVNYLVDRIGPSFTERMRKLLEEEEGDEGAAAAAAATSIANELQGNVHSKSTPLSSTSLTRRSLRSNSTATMASNASSLRFKGSAHPAIATSPSRSQRSNSQSTIPASNF